MRLLNLPQYVKTWVAQASKISRTPQSADSLSQSGTSFVPSSCKQLGPPLSSSRLSASLYFAALLLQNLVGHNKCQTASLRSGRSPSKVQGGGEPASVSTDSLLTWRLYFLRFWLQRESKDTTDLQHLLVLPLGLLPPSPEMKCFSPLLSSRLPVLIALHPMTLSLKSCFALDM